MSILLHIGPALDRLTAELAKHDVRLDPAVIRKIKDDLESDRDPHEEVFYTLHQSPGLVISGHVQDSEPETIWIGFSGEFDRYRPIEKRAEAWDKVEQEQRDKRMEEAEKEFGPEMRARSLIDAAHRQDPAQTEDGQPAELVYANRIEAWVAQLAPGAPRHLLVAARCQHLERFLTPRTTFPDGKAGYLQWRRHLYQKQAARARELVLEAGMTVAQADDIARWVSKTDLKKDAGSQALEDAAVLVFLENEIGAFAAQHADYPHEKFVDILRKTWRKLSPAAQQQALALDLPPAIAALVREAVHSSR